MLDFTPSYRFVDFAGSVVAVDVVSRRIAFSDAVGKYRIYKSSDIISVERLETRSLVTRTSTFSQIVRAFAWRCFFGEKGFWVGARSGKELTDDMLTSITLKIYIRDIDSPLKELCFYRGKPIQIGGKRCSRFAASAEEWRARIRLLTDEPAPPSGPITPSEGSRLRRRLRRR